MQTPYSWVLALVFCGNNLSYLSDFQRWYTMVYQSPALFRNPEIVPEGFGSILK